MTGCGNAPGATGGIRARWVTGRVTGRVAGWSVKWGGG